MKKCVTSKEEVVGILQRNQHRLRVLGVARVGLFGSFVTGRQNETSDVDLLVEFETGKKNFDRFMQVAFLLEDLLQRQVELVTPESLSPHLGPNTLREVEYVALAP